MCDLFISDPRRRGNDGRQEGRHEEATAGAEAVRRVPVHRDQRGGHLRQAAHLRGVQAELPQSEGEYLK